MEDYSVIIRVARHAGILTWQDKDYINNGHRPSREDILSSSTSHPQTPSTSIPRTQRHIAKMKAFTTISLLLTAIIGVSALPSDNTPVVETTVEGEYSYVGQATVSFKPASIFSSVL